MRSEAILITFHFNKFIYFEVIYFYFKQLNNKILERKLRKFALRAEKSILSSIKKYKSPQAIKFNK